VQRFKPAPLASSRDDSEKPKEEDWEVITKLENESETHGNHLSSNFNLQVGWGSWRTSILSWDVSVRTDHTHLPDSSWSKGNTGGDKGGNE
ncbi:hypothetical protein CSPAE12_11336, partial [Colletotrichum incanum]